jgi:thiol:disulfide interchange protein DsbC
MPRRLPYSSRPSVRLRRAGMNPGAAALSQGWERDSISGHGMTSTHSFSPFVGAALLALAAASGPLSAQETRVGSDRDAIPPEVRTRVASKLHGVKPSDVASSPIPGLYEVTMGGVVAYVSEDGKFLVSGDVYDLDSQTNLTAGRRSSARAKALAAVREGDMVIFSPANPKMTVTVFTDVDCGYCRKFHSQIAEYNKAGIRVRYLSYPRTGPGTSSWAKAESVWCAADRKDALTRAKRDEEVKSKPCGDALIKAQYELGGDLGVEGTPAIFTTTGDYVGGYLPPAQLVQTIQEKEKAAAAAAR